MGCLSALDLYIHAYSCGLVGLLKLPLRWQSDWGPYLNTDQLTGESLDETRGFINRTLPKAKVCAKFRLASCGRVYPFFFFLSVGCFLAANLVCLAFWFIALCSVFHLASTSFSRNSLKKYIVCVFNFGTYVHRDTSSQPTEWVGKRWQQRRNINLNSFDLLFR